ncbi:hypothetical protein NDR87_26365 [Nocardia sp. CDC159]|uniref:Secreted protein n=1 Tax=Nocardia pulmonis TaxID=2951408 RepID=A0A9X2E625_9NOCA|nr:MULTISPECIES: hypothetical protein [Nocardia]MCM6774972.1 hypothetical protein [Nocardia pulmonis]MCM6789903.1 hypothetical protein [Nocardia sp. CDC159]
MLTRTVRLAALAAALIISASPAAVAGPFDTGSAGPQPPPPPTVRFGDYCRPETAASGTTARTSDGRTAHCVQVSHTDAFVWWPVPGAIPVDPHNRVSPGDPCLDEGARWIDDEGRHIVCERTQSGRQRGDLRWMLDR